MQCPKDGSEFAIVNRSGIEIDYCPTCKGVWLDYQELEKLINLADQPQGTELRDSAQQGAELVSNDGSALADIFDFFDGIDV